MIHLISDFKTREPFLNSHLFYLYVFTSLSSLHYKLLHYCCDLCNSSSSEHGTVEPHCPGDRQFTSGNVVVVVNVVNVSGSLEIHSCAPPWRKEKRGARKKRINNEKILCANESPLLHARICVILFPLV